MHPYIAKVWGAPKIASGVLGTNVGVGEGGGGGGGGLGPMTKAERSIMEDHMKMISSVAGIFFFFPPFPFYVP